ncbi:glycoside hydrolase [Spinellus fusiger]|nr:glycoside hydrolase [Spinellus fusiger]
MLPTHHTMKGEPMNYDDDKYNKHERSIFNKSLVKHKCFFLLIFITLCTLCVYLFIYEYNPVSRVEISYEDIEAAYKKPSAIIEPSPVVLPDYPEIVLGKEDGNKDAKKKKISEKEIFGKSQQNSSSSYSQALYRQKRIIESFQHAWKGYTTDAFGADEYQPLTHTGHNWAEGGLGLMIVDALDTMLLMNLTEEYAQARHWIDTRLDFDKNQDVNLFETTIRILGGLLSAYHLSNNDTLYLEKATDLGNRLMGAFGSESGIPYASVILSTGLAYKFHIPSSTAEVTTIQLEFKYLSYLTGDPKYRLAAEGVMQHMEKLIEKGDTIDGLVPILIHPVDGTFATREIRLGSRGDSYYEYLLKQYLQTAKTEPHYRAMYDHALEGIQKHLLARSYPNHLLYIGELLDGNTENIHPKMDHLVCFMGGSYALGATEGRPLSELPPLNEKNQRDMDTGREITETCYKMYNSTATGLASEIVYFNNDKGTNPDAPDITIHLQDRHNLLRPETLESLFLLWRLTGEEKYRKWGWKIFESFEEHTKLPEGGYSALKDVTEIPARRDNRMDTFFLAETLKYLYLMFSPNDVLPLDKYVLNTEAHPLPIFKPNW